MTEVITMEVKREGCGEYLIRVRGAIFCQVINNKQLFHLSPSITSGIQK